MKRHLRLAPTLALALASSLGCAPGDEPPPAPPALVLTPPRDLRVVATALPAPPAAVPVPAPPVALPHGVFATEDATPLGYPTRLALGADGLIIASDPESDAVFAYRDGRRVWALTGVARPLGVAVVGAQLFVGSARRGAVERFDLVSRRWLGFVGTGPGAFKRPNDLALAPDGVLYVVDSDADAVVAFAAPDYRVGTPLGAPGELRFPVAVAADRERVVIADQGHHRLRVYDRGGRWLRDLGHQLAGDASAVADFDLAFTRLQGLDLAGGRLFVLDAHHGHVQILGPDDRPLGFVGRLGGCVSCVSLPLDVAVGADGRVLVSDPLRVRWVSLPLPAGVTP